jgi:uncharacterized tellurite resistance protein B-like protein
MVLSLLKRLMDPSPEVLDEPDARLALSALLVRMARTDGQYDMVEAAEITRILMERYALDHQAAETLRSEAEALELDAPDTVRFTRAIKAAVGHEDRAEVAEALWQVVLSDGTRDHEEDGLMRLVVGLLGINDRDSAHARHRVEARRL